MADPVRKQPAGGVLDDDPFFYGSRWISVRLPDGRIVDEQIPLTPDDLLDPQPGDQVTQSDKHVEMMIWLFRLLKPLRQSPCSQKVYHQNHRHRRQNLSRRHQNKKTQKKMKKAMRSSSILFEH